MDLTAHPRTEFPSALSFGALIALLLIGVACGPPAPTVFQLSKQPAMPSQIVVSPRPTAAERRAADLLSEHIGTVLGAPVPIVTDVAASVPGEIIVGWNSHAQALGLHVDLPALGADGFVLRTMDARLLLAGGTGSDDKGAIYAATTFLEQHLGFRFYAPDVLVAPAAMQVEIPDGLDVVQVPAIEYREDFYRGAWDPAFGEWHKLDRHGKEWGMWVHTFATLVSPDDYFDEHPEWFAEVEGRRVPQGQLCLTHEGMYQTLVTNLRARIEAEPEKHYWSVSQNDTYGFCTCDRCAAIDAEQDAHSGSLIHFINRVAAEFPDKTISTLAYQYSRKAPENLRPADNVLVVLAPIELNRSRPVATDPSAAGFRTELEDWARVTDRLLIWDYVIQFSNLVSPFPNLRVLQPNLQYFVANSAVAHFQQGNREIGGEWAELRAYVIAKLLWNPDIDVDATINDFLSGYYGAAAPHLRAYIDTQHDALAASGAALGIFGNPVGASRSYLTPELMATYEAQFDQAEVAVAGNTEHLQRLRWARQPLRFARLEQAKAGATGADGVFERSPSDNWQPKPEILARIDEFVAIAQEQGVTRVHEWHTPPAEYGARYRQMLQRVPTDHLAVGHTPIFATPFSDRYPAEGAATIVDGLHSPMDHTFGWIGWNGEDLQATIDLGTPQPVRRVAAGFMQSTNSWIWLPLSVQVELSDDGVNWQPAGSTGGVADEHESSAVETFAVEFPVRTTRYVRVKAINRRTCPDWHIGAAGKAWIFTDEIVVE